MNKPTEHRLLGLKILTAIELPCTLPAVRLSSNFNTSDSFRTKFDRELEQLLGNYLVIYIREKDGTILMNPAVLVDLEFLAIKHQWTHSYQLYQEFYKRRTKAVKIPELTYAYRQPKLDTRYNDHSARVNWASNLAVTITNPATIIHPNCQP